MRYTQNPASLVVKEVIYGINLHSLEVERVMIGCEGTAVRRNANGSITLHKIKGSDIESEIRAVFHLISQETLPPGIKFERHPAIIRLRQRSESLKVARGTTPLPYAQIRPGAVTEAELGLAS